MYSSPRYIAEKASDPDEVLVMLLATPFLTADAGEAFSLQVGMQDISIAGPPSKCTGGPARPC